ncbi:hypothetical protein BJX99DRAFT_256066 [Aspergillus californicus]
MSTLKLIFDESENDGRERMGRYSEWKQFCVLQRCLEGDLSVADTSRELYEMLPTAEERLCVEDFLSVILWDIAGQIPYSHPAQDKLVEAIKFLSRADRLNTIAVFHGCRRHSEMQTFYIEVHGYAGSDWETEEAERPCQHDWIYCSLVLNWPLRQPVHPDLSHLTEPRG